MKGFVALLVILVSTSLLADEGMWMPQQVPLLGDQLKRMGLQLDPRQLADLTGFPMNAIVSTGGCSASFVSPQGLIVTNHHCVYGYLQYNSTPQTNRIAEGFLAKTMADEPQASPDARVFVTTAIRDVTGEILGGLDKKKMTDIDRFKTIDRRRKEMVSECEKGGGLRCQVASFFEGTQFLEVTQMEIRDVRLVYAPPDGIGTFGGDTDNWMWPRHTGDFGYIRAYVGKDGKPADFSKDNVPYQPKHYLKVGTGDIDPGDLMLVVGYPGITFRYKTASETRTAEEFEFPMSIQYRRDLIAILEEQGGKDEAVAIRNVTRIRSLANILKKYEGTLEGFKKGNLIARREAEERQLATFYANDATSAKELAAVMAELDRIGADLEATRRRDTVLGWLYTASPMLSQANALYRLSVERTKKDVDRALDYQQRDLPRRKAAIARAQRIIDPGSDRAGLRHFLLESRKLPADQRIKPVDEAITAAGGVDALLDRLYGNTKIADLEARNAMFDESTAALKARGDAFIDFAASLRGLGDDLEKRDEVIKGAMARLRPRYVQTVKTLRGGLLAPDANSTLRISFGTVKGYEPRDGVMYEPHTTIEGVAEKDTGGGEFMSPKQLLERSSKREFGPYADPDLGTLPVNFLSTGDITNGSSGSATLNAKGELVGLAFDGNYEAMGSDFVVNPELSRTIHVDGRYMLWVMDAVDGAHNLLREMGVTPQFEGK